MIAIPTRNAASKSHTGFTEDGYAEQICLNILSSSAIDKIKLEVLVVTKFLRF
jgi:hypothetical protein